ncbi:MAG: hypothetical protein BMS9Abin28_0706 [Anaerolineae bacterium]|nr:MAG: hypothetical protein BMS9Abin28_0706 [Anaerolineae bacterium]
MSDKFDVAVIGAGQGGLPAAHMAANLGAKVLLVEAREVGGT